MRHRPRAAVGGRAGDGGGGAVSEQTGYLDDLILVFSDASRRMEAHPPPTQPTRPWIDLRAGLAGLALRTKASLRLSGSFLEVAGRFFALCEYTYRMPNPFASNHMLLPETITSYRITKSVTSVQKTLLVFAIIKISELSK